MANIVLLVDLHTGLPNQPSSLQYCTERIRVTDDTGQYSIGVHVCTFARHDMNNISAFARNNVWHVESRYKTFTHTHDTKHVL